MAKSPFDLAQAWLTIRIDDEGKLIDAVRLLDELRFELKKQLGETKRSRDRSFQHFATSIMIQVSGKLGKKRPADWVLPPRAYESGTPVINYVRLKHYANKIDLTPDELASLIVTNSASRTLFDSQAQAKRPPEAKRSNAPLTAPKSLPTRKNPTTDAVPVTPSRTSGNVRMSESARSERSGRSAGQTSIRHVSSGLPANNSHCIDAPLNEKRAGKVQPTQHMPEEHKRGVTVLCGNCKRPGHTVRDCIGPVDEDGWIDACPMCNDNGHIYDDCRLRSELQGIAKREIDESLLLFYRQNKPSIKSRISWVNIYNQRHPLLISLPWTPEFAKKQETLAAKFKVDESMQQDAYSLDLGWNTYTYQWIGNPDLEARFRTRDPAVDDFAISKLRFRLRLP